MLLQSQNDAVCDDGGQDHVLKRSEVVKEQNIKTHKEERHSKYYLQFAKPATRSVSFHGTSL